MRYVNFIFTLLSAMIIISKKFLSVVSAMFLLCPTHTLQKLHKNKILGMINSRRQVKSENCTVNYKGLN